jgi:hypothetical protein
MSTVPGHSDNCWTGSATTKIYLLLIFAYKEGDPEWFEGIYDRAWWIDFFAESVVFKRDRGVAIVKIGMGVER